MVLVYLLYKMNPQHVAIKEKSLPTTWPDYALRYSKALVGLRANLYGNIVQIETLLEEEDPTRFTGQVTCKKTTPRHVLMSQKGVTEGFYDEHRVCISALQYLGDHPPPPNIAKLRYEALETKILVLSSKIEMLTAALDALGRNPLGNAD